MKTRELIVVRDRKLLLDESEARSTLRLVAPNGDVELTIEVGPCGSTVRLSAANLEISADRDISITGAKVALKATEHLSIESGGDLDVGAKSGSLRLRAHDDISVDGERVLLNSPASAPAVSWEQFMERVARDEA